MSDKNIYFDINEQTIYTDGTDNQPKYFYPNSPSKPGDNDTNKVWKTDGQGIPGWRDDANDGTNITLSVTGNGNAIDSISMNNGTISATKNTNFLTSSNVENKNAQLSFGNTSTIATIGGINIKVTMPSGSSFTLLPASGNDLGGIKTGYDDTGNTNSSNANYRNYAVQLDSNNKAYVNVPWSASINSSNISNNLTDDTKVPTVKAMVTYINNLVSTGNGGSY